MLENVKPGDILVIFKFASVYGLSKVDRVTKTQVITTKGAKYRKSGSIIGGGFLNAKPFNSFDESKQSEICDAIETIRKSNDDIKKKGILKAEIRKKLDLICRENFQSLDLSQLDNLNSFLEDLPKN